MEVVCVLSKRLRWLIFSVTHCLMLMWLKPIAICLVLLVLFVVITMVLPAYWEQVLILAFMMVSISRRIHRL